MPRIKLMEDPAVAALVEKRVGQAQQAAQAVLARHHKATHKAVRDAIAAAGLADKKVMRAIQTHVMAALPPLPEAAPQPGFSAAEAAD